MIGAEVTDTFEMTPSDRGEPDLGAIPACHAVVALEDRASRTILLGITADARRFVRARLSAPEAPDAGPTRRADLRAVTARALLVRVGSRFEAEAVYLDMARRRLPRIYRALTDRWRAWFVHVDPEAEFPDFAKTNLTGPVAPRSAATPVGVAGRGGVLLGPLPDKDAAGRYIERLVDLFDLCRFHRILVQAPGGAACAYKQMGRCPAPCDGSETMPSYRGRVREAVRFVDRPIGEHVEAQRRAMERAAADLDFESAEGHKRRLERLAALDKPAFARVAPIERFRWVLAAPSERAGWVRLFLCDVGRLHVLADVDGGADAGVVDDLIRVIGRVLGRPGVYMGEAEQRDTIGLVSRWLLTPRRRRPWRVIGLGREDAAVDAGALRRAISAVGRAGPDAADSHDEMELEGESRAS